MDTALCREHLDKLLVEEAHTLERLETLLGEEHGFLVGNDIEALERAGVARQACMGELIRTEDERRSLCRMMGMSSDLPGLEKLLNWCDPTHTLHARWVECTARVKRCRELNDRNGALVTGRLKRVEGLLGILTGKTKEAPTYGKQGGYKAPQAGRVFSLQV